MVVTTIDGLFPYISYELWIAAVNGHGDGEKNETIVMTDSEGKTCSFELLWTTLNKNRVPGSGQFYFVVEKSHNKKYPKITRFKNRNQYVFISFTDMKFNTDLSYNEIKLS